ncbi:Exocyst complex component 8 [Sarcoptes scabiei]|uniref:Exocyst complex component 8 n=1 Tax=Sarcoptes scabiei TaxID=52283 RepID=A0A834VCC7_SARSC|nr:Exocyst complex component 8 [Sarcoptes scabiei]UXI18023.1 dimethyladenosine transferase 1 [Sarcoptes scabiei]
MMSENVMSPSMNQIKKDPMLYVSALTAKPSVTLEELLNARKSVQNCAVETNTQLKKNVYKNYQLFIDTSKEISYLKTEMSQLSSFLNDEYKLLESFLSISIGGSKTGLTPSEKKEALEKAKEERERKMLQMSRAIANGPVPNKEFSTIIDYIEGGAGMLDNRQNCLVYCDGEVIELDENYLETQSLYLVLLNDALIITTLIDKKMPAKNSINPQIPIRKYKFQSIIDLESIAVVNVKDRRYSKFEMAFKILMTTSDKIFLTSSSAKKKAWIDAFEAAKKFLRTNRLQRRDSIFHSSSSIDNNDHLFNNLRQNSNLYDENSSVAASESGLSYSSSAYNPFEEKNHEKENDNDLELPHWLMDLPDDLDVCIAQRNFEEAVKLVTKAQEHFYLYPKWCDDQMQVDLKLKIDNKIAELVEALSNELNIGPDRSLQTGPRASRRAVSLLVRLGKSTLAISLFLEQRKRLLKYYYKQQKIVDGATSSFMKRMTNLFFSHFVETTRKFMLAFDIGGQSNPIALQQDESYHSSEPNTSLGWLDEEQSKSKTPTLGIGNELDKNQSNSPNLCSHTAIACLNSWIYHEFNRYLDLFTRHVFIKQVNHLVAIECISMAIHHCHKLRQTIGLDLLFVLSRKFKKEIHNFIDEISQKFSETIRLRANEHNDRKPLVFDSKSKYQKFLAEIKEYGFTELPIADQIEDQTNSDGAENFKIILKISSNTILFAKSYLKTLKDLLKLADNAYSIQMINSILVESFQWQMNYLKNILDQSILEQSNEDEKFIRSNIIFVLEKLVPIVIRKYCETLGARSMNSLQSISLQYSYLKESNYDRNHSRISSRATSSVDSRDYSPIDSPTPTPRLRKSKLSDRNSNSSIQSQSDSSKTFGSPTSSPSGRNRFIHPSNNYL